MDAVVFIKQSPICFVDNELCGCVVCLMITGRSASGSVLIVDVPSHHLQSVGEVWLDSVILQVGARFLHSLDFPLHRPLLAFCESSPHDLDHALI